MCQICKKTEKLSKEYAQKIRRLCKELHDKGAKKTADDIQHDLITRKSSCFIYEDEKHIPEVISLVEEIQKYFNAFEIERETKFNCKFKWRNN